MGSGIGPGREPASITFAEVRQTGAFVTSGRVERRLVAILAADVAGVSWLFVLQRNRMSLDRPGFMPARYCKTSTCVYRKLHPS